LIKMRTRNFIIFMVLSQLMACMTIIPGHHMRQFSTESSEDMPVTEDNETLLQRLNIQKISAKLIVDIEKDLSNFSSDPNNVSNHYFDYRIGSTTKKGTPEKETYIQYLVGPRDVLKITVWGHPELTIPAGQFRSAAQAGNLVGEDGTFFYPYAGVVQAEGRTVEEIREELTKKLSKYIEEVQLDVRVAEYRSQRVYVVGEVENAGVYLVQDIPLTVLEAINRAGGATEDADLRNLTLTRGDKTYGINLLNLYEGGILSQNVLLKHGDVLNVPDNEFNKVFVLGENTFGRFRGQVRTVVMNKARMTLTEAISEGGGVIMETADAARIFVFRTGTGKSEIFHLNAKSPDALILAERFNLQPRDIVYVDTVEGIRWNRIIRQLQPTMDLVESMSNVANNPF